MKGECTGCTGCTQHALQQVANRPSLQIRIKRQRAANNSQNCMISIMQSSTTVEPVLKEKMKSTQIRGKGAGHTGENSLRCSDFWTGIVYRSGVVTSEGALVTSVNMSAMPAAPSNSKRWHFKEPQERGKAISLCVRIVVYNNIHYLLQLQVCSCCCSKTSWNLAEN